MREEEKEKEIIKTEKESQFMVLMVLAQRLTEVPIVHVDTNR